jgi:hypothetical protein
MSKNKAIFAITVLLCMVCLVTLASRVDAREIKTFEETKAKISLGYFLPRMNTEIRLDPANPALPDGDLINLENDLGLDRDLSLGRLDGYYRLGRKHRLQFGYFTLERDAQRVIDQNLTIGDYTFQVSGQVDSYFKNTITQIGYMYSLRQTDRFEVSGTFGIHWLDVRSQITGMTTPGGTVEISSSSAEGPLPLIGFDLDYAFTSRWIISLRGMLFSMKLDTFDGNLTDVRGSLEYFFMNNLGVGLGVNRFDMDLTYSDNGRDGEFSWGYDGVQLYITARL